MDALYHRFLCFIGSFFFCITAFAQPNYTANNSIVPYTAGFYAGVNMGVFPPFSDEDLADLAIGNGIKGILGIGARALRPGLFESFLGVYGYDSRLSTYAYFKSMGLDKHTAIVGFPQDSLRDTSFYCAAHRSELFANLYEPIWINGQVNPNNYYAHYLWETVSRYKNYIKIWEIWNEPGFDYTYFIGYQEAGSPGNWWDNDPNPCDYKLRAPIQHYVRMLRISYEIIKTLDPEAYVLCGGVGYPAFLDAVLRNTDNPNGGAVSSAFPLKGGAYFDILGYHSYPHFDGTTRAWNTATNQFDYFRHSDAAAKGILKLRDGYTPILEKYGYNGLIYPKKLITITEINLPRKSYQYGFEGDVVQRNFITKAYVTCAKENFVQMHVYALSELSKEEQADEEFDLMGLYKRLRYQDGIHQIQNSEGLALKTTTDLLFQKKYDANRTALLQMNAQTDGAAFKDEKTGLYTYVLWAKTTVDKSETAQATFTFPSAVQNRPFLQYTWDFGKTNASTQIVIGQAIQLTASPVFFTENAILPSKTSICKGETIQYSSQAGVAFASQKWFFENGNPATSTQAQATVAYASAGNFTTKAIFLAANGDTILQQTQHIKVDALPTPSFSYEQNGALLHLKNTTKSDVLPYVWNFGDSQTSSIANPSHVYAQDGAYTVRLNAANLCGTGSATKTIQVDVPTLQLSANTANNSVPPFTKAFRPGVHLNFVNNWSEEQLSDIAAGNPIINQSGVNQSGVGARSAEVDFPHNFLEYWSYDIRVPAHQHSVNLNMTDLVAVLGFPTDSARETRDYCATNTSFAFKNIYTDIWDNGLNGTPINEKNPFALYVWKTVHTYKDYVEFWQIFQTPDYDATSNRAYLPPGQEGNWWDYDPDPCDVSFHAPIQSYVRMLRIVYEIVRLEDPTAQVLLGSVSFPSFLDAVLRNTDNPDQGKVLTGVFEKKGGAYFDAFGFNAYPHIDGSTKRYDVPTSQFIYSRHSDAAVKGLLDLKNKFDTVFTNRGYNGQIYPKKTWVVSQTNAPRIAFNDYFGGEVAQRNYLTKAVVLAHANAIKRLTVQNLSEETPDAEAYLPGQVMGLYRSLKNVAPYNQSKNDAGKAFHTASDLLFESTFDAARTAVLQTPTNVAAYAFKSKKGSYIYALWAKTQTDLSENAQATYTFPTGIVPANLYRKTWDWADSGQQSVVSPTAIPLTAAPIFITESEKPALLPMAHFSASALQICSGQSVLFKNLSLFADSVVWAFPRASVLNANPAAPLVRFDSVGKYDIYLTAYNADGSNVLTKFGYIEVSTVPVADFNATLVGPQLTASQNSLGKVDSITWILPNGNRSGAYNISYFFIENGDFTLTMIAHNACGSDTISKHYTLALNPSAAFNVILPQECNAFYAGLQNIAYGSPTSFEWYIPNGTPSYSTNPNEWVIFPSAGSYSATLVVSNAIGSDTLRQTFDLLGSATHQIRDSLCSGESVTIAGTLFDQNNPNGTVLLPEAALGGCDSLIEVHLHFYPTKSDTLVHTLAIGESYDFCGTSYNTVGLYTCFLTDAKGCDSLVVLDLRGIIPNKDLTNAFEVRMYPNPSQNLLFLDFENIPNEQQFFIEITDIKGSQINQKWTVESKKTVQISLAHLASGNYVVVLRSNKGQVLFKEILAKF